ncbi:MAG: bifunctional folylpolyglutamate synthase/dihydrofolate synthase [Clostridiales bacterium]|jgi:dihydrofolate synthase/folylpolyglutamate synthase|nr:bifunctional folylpolyglutamate synthase/dihydrofolate synthase [Clostridiales bacterium]
MRYSEALAFYQGADGRGCVLGLASMRALMSRLSDPQDGLSVVHVAGTNGKGSTIAYLDSILRAGGYRTGCYRTPALTPGLAGLIEVDGREIPKRAVGRLTPPIKRAAESMTERGLPPPTRFECETALAFLFFRSENCGIVLLETGLGGRDDATNIIQKPLLSVMTPIGMDHAALLGGTVGEIAEKKAGIIKAGRAVVSAVQPPQAAAVIERAARERGSGLTLADPAGVRTLEADALSRRFCYSGRQAYTLALGTGASYQIQNAVTAVAAAERLGGMGFPVTKEQVEAGIAKAVWPGRFTRVLAKPPFFIDGAHNPPAAEALAETLRTYFADKRLILIVGMFRDKDADGVLSPVLPLADRVVTVDMPKNKRLRRAEEMKSLCAPYCRDVVCAASVRDAAAKSIAAAGEDGVVAAFGSLSFLYPLMIAAGRISHGQ